MKLIHGSAHSIPDLADGSVQMICTSPPYWGLRAYAGEQGIEWPTVSYAPMPGLPELTIPAQRCGLGLEPTIEAYIGHLVLCLREWRRVLRDDGCAFVNLGDSYAANRSGGQPAPTNTGNRNGYLASDKQGVMSVPSGLKAKDLCGIPWRFAFAAQADGWWLRSDIIWAKPNPMPESVQDRPTRSHEYLFLLTKSQRYYWDADAVREGMVKGAAGSTFTHGKTGINGLGRVGQGERENNPAGRNLRSVWTIATQPTPFAHFATYPEKLVEPCIKAGTSARGCCPKCGAPWVRVVEASGGTIGTGWTDHTADLTKGMTQAAFRAGSAVDANGKEYTRETLGWRPGCAHDAEPVPCTVLDPFHGSGTTGKVALRLGRHYIGVDIAPEYLTTVTDARFANGVQTEMPL